MPNETDREFLERMKTRRGFPTRDDVVRMDRIRREGGGGNGISPWSNQDSRGPQPR